MLRGGGRWSSEEGNAEGGQEEVKQPVLKEIVREDLSHLNIAILPIMSSSLYCQRCIYGGSCGDEGGLGNGDGDGDGWDGGLDDGGGDGDGNGDVGDILPFAFLFYIPGSVRDEQSPGYVILGQKSETIFF